MFTIQKFIGNNPRLFKYDQAPMLGEILFDSDFESGNLDFVFKLENTSIYYCFMRMDTNTKGHTQWFYFKIWNTKANEPITFHICNCEKEKTLFGKGLKPYVFSKKKNQFK